MPRSAGAIERDLGSAVNPAPPVTDIYFMPRWGSIASDCRRVNYSDPSGLSSCFSYLQWVGTLYHNGEYVLDGYVRVNVCIGDGVGRGRPSVPTIGPMREGVREGGGGSAPAAPSSGPVAGPLGACTAAGLDAAFAVAEDVVSLTGFGMVATKGTRGAQLAVKLARAGGWLVEDRLKGFLLPSGAMRGRANWAMGGALGVTWMGTSNALKGESFNVWEELGGLIPILNMTIKVRTAVSLCFGG